MTPEPGPNRRSVGPTLLEALLRGRRVWLDADGRDLPETRALVDRVAMRHLGRTPVKVIRCARGLECLTYILTLPEGARYSLRLPPVADHDQVFRAIFDRHSRFNAAVRAAGTCMVPAVVAVGGRAGEEIPHLLLEYLEGEPLDERIAADPRQDRFAEAAGRLLARVHETGADEVGFLDATRPITGWGAFICEMLDTHVRCMVEVGALEASQAADIVRHAEALVAASSYHPRPSLLHMDFRPNNVIVLPGTEARLGLIDAGGAIWGDAACEVARVRVNGFASPAWLAGYRSVRALPVCSPGWQALYEIDYLAELVSVYARLASSSATRNGHLARYTQVATALLATEAM